MSLPKPEPLTPPCGISEPMARCSLIQTVPGLELARGALGAEDVARPGRGGEAVARVVGLGERLVVGAEAEHADDGAEDLVLDDLGVLGGAGDHGRRVEGAGAVGQLAAALGARAGGDGALDEARGRGRAGRARRAGRGWCASSIGSPTTSRSTLCRKRSMNASRTSLVDVDPRGGRAVLAAVGERADDRALGGRLEVGVLEHHERRLAAELHVHALDRAGGLAHHARAGAGGAGDRDQRDVLVAGERAADLRPGPGHAR